MWALQRGAFTRSRALRVSAWSCGQGRPRAFGLGSFTPLVEGEVLGAPSFRLWLQHRGQHFAGGFPLKDPPPGSVLPANQLRGAPRFGAGLPPARSPAGAAELDGAGGAGTHVSARPPGAWQEVTMASRAPIWGFRSQGDLGATGLLTSHLLTAGSARGIVWFSELWSKRGLIVNVTSSQPELRAPRQRRARGGPCDGGFSPRAHRPGGFSPPTAAAGSVSGRPAAPSDGLSTASG